MYVHMCTSNVVKAGHSFKGIIKSHVSLNSVLLNSCNLCESKPIFTRYLGTHWVPFSFVIFFSFLSAAAEQNQVSTIFDGIFSIREKYKPVFDDAFSRKK